MKKSAEVGRRDCRGGEVENCFTIFNVGDSLVKNQTPIRDSVGFHRQLSAGQAHDYFRNQT